MPVVKYGSIQREEVTMKGVSQVTRSNVIGPPEGWAENTMRVFTIAPGGFTPHHQHDYEHVNYVIKGKGTLTIGDETFKLEEKDFAFVPPNAMHQFRNPNAEPFEFICIVPQRGA
jgi:quercetin dioxygenase-like cupin family protein